MKGKINNNTKQDSFTTFINIHTNSSNICMNIITDNQQHCIRFWFSKIMRDWEITMCVVCRRIFTRLVSFDFVSANIKSHAKLEWSRSVTGDLKKKRGKKINALKLSNVFQKQDFLINCKLPVSLTYRRVLTNYFR